MQFNTHLNFDGNCRAAFEYYEKLFGGRVTLMLTYGESPMAAHVPAEDHGKILHATCEFGDQRLTGADLPTGRYGKPRGFDVMLSLEDPQEAERIFAALEDGGLTQMPLQETFWSLRFGMVADRFGTPWMINCDKTA